MEALWRYRAGNIVFAVSIIDDAHYLVAGLENDYIYLLDHYGMLLWKYKIGSPVYSVSISDNGEYIAASSRGGHIYLLRCSLNKPPIARFTYTPSEPTDLDEITFESGSYDPDGEIVSYEWDFGDGHRVSGNLPVVTIPTLMTDTIRLD